MQPISQRLGDAFFKWGFILMHVSVLLVLWTGASWFAVGACVFLYYIRMFGLTAGYHRYFSHRSYKTSRFFQFVMAFLGASAMQKGPLWWSAHHRHHHRFSDTEDDVHSPITRSVWWAHVGWIFSEESRDTRKKLIPDLLKYPELHWIERNHLVAPISLAVFLFGLGTLLEAVAPGLGTNGLQLTVWGFFVSTVVLWHGTFTVNSLAHLFGRRRFSTTDHSRNSLLIALITMGEGWHNNHHRFLASERQGFYWWEVDASHYILTVLSWFGIVWDINKPPQKIYDEARHGRQSSIELRKSRKAIRRRARARLASKPPRIEPVEAVEEEPMLVE